MDLLYPAHLVFHYERLMSLAFALCERPVSALLLGVGGAAMWRFLRAYVPECATTLVDADEGVVAIAKRWFYLSQPVIIDTAEHFLAGNTQHFDVLRRPLRCARAGTVRRRLLGALHRRPGAGRLSGDQLGRFRHQQGGAPMARRSNRWRRRAVSTPIS